MTFRRDENEYPNRDNPYNREPSYTSNEEDGHIKRPRSLREQYPTNNYQQEEYPQQRPYGGQEQQDMQNQQDYYQQPNNAYQEPQASYQEPTPQYNQEQYNQEQYGAGHQYQQQNYEQERYDQPATYNNEEEYPTASLVERIVAYIIDYFIVSIISSFFIAIPLVVMVLLEMNGTLIMFLISLISMVVTYGYWAVLTATKLEGTIGKKVMGLKVKTLDNKRVTFGQSVLRSVMLITGWFLLLGLVLEKGQNRLLNDIVAKTKVVKVKK